MAMGEAAGMAGALSAEGKVSPQALTGSQVSDRLVQVGAGPIDRIPVRL
jgi:hypothetical protein